MASQDATYVLGSIFDFRAPEEVIEAFKSTPEGREVICKYSAETRQFEIHGGRGDGEQTFLVFLEVVKKYIAGEVAKVGDVFDVANVERVADSLVDYDDELSDIEVAVTNEDDDHDESNHAEGQGGELISHETVTKTWNVLGAGKFVKEIFTTSVLGMIGMVTNCRVEMNEVKGGILVKGESDEEVIRALAKLEVLNTAMSHRKSGNWTFEFSVDEGETNYHLHIMTLKEAGGRRSRTTLLPSLDSSQELLVVVMVKWNTAGQTYDKVEYGSQLLKATGHRGRLWTEHEYKGRGKMQGHTSWKQSSTTSSRVSGEATAIPRVLPTHPHPIERWVETSGAAKSNAFAALDEETKSVSLSNSGGQSMMQRQIKQRPPPTYKKTIRIPKGQKVIDDKPQSAATSLQANAATSSSSPAPFEGLDYNGRNIGQAVTRFTSTITSQQPSQGTMAVEENALLGGYNMTPPAIEPPRMPKRSNASSIDGENSTVARNVGESSGLGESAWRAQIVREEDDLLLLGDRRPRPRYVTRGPTTHATVNVSAMRQSGYYSQQVKQDDDNRENAAKEDRQPRKLDFQLSSTKGNHQTYTVNVLPIAGSDKQISNQEELVDTGIPGEDQSAFNQASIPEALQNVSELETRKLRRTMDQQKSIPSSSCTKSNLTLLNLIESAAAEILGLSRSSPGLVTLKVDIGRVLVEATTAIQEYKKTSFAPSEWSTIFHTKKGAGEAQTLFTNILTTSWVDAEFILDLKWSSGRRMFVEEPHKRKVVYELWCRDKEGIEVVLEVDEDAKYKVFNPTTEVGNINWHFSKRLWDARLTVNEITEADDKYLDVMKGFVDNLNIPSSCTQIELLTQGVNTDLEIHTILVRRETCHSSTTHPDLVLHLTEVQELVLQTMGGSTSQYRAFAGPPEEMVKDGNRLWWEAGLSSNTADAILEENQALEIGDLTTWTAEAFVEMGLIKDLFGLAKEVVARIDSVGFGNKAVRAEGSALETQTEGLKDIDLRSKPDTNAPVPEEFW